MTVRLDRRPDQYRRGEAPLFVGTRWEPSRSSAFFTICTEATGSGTAVPGAGTSWRCCAGRAPAVLVLMIGTYPAASRRANSSGTDIPSGYIRLIRGFRRRQQVSHFGPQLRLDPSCVP